MKATHTQFNLKQIEAHLQLHNKNFMHLPATIYSYKDYLAKLPYLDGDQINSLTEEDFLSIITQQLEKFYFWNNLF